MVHGRSAPDVIAVLSKRSKDMSSFLKELLNFVPSKFKSSHRKRRNEQTTVFFLSTISNSSRKKSPIIQTYRTFRSLSKRGGSERPWFRNRRLPTVDHRASDPSAGRVSAGFATFRGSVAEPDLDCSATRHWLVVSEVAGTRSAALERERAGGAVGPAFVAEVKVAGLRPAHRAGDRAPLDALEAGAAKGRRELRPEARGSGAVRVDHDAG